MKFIIFLLCSVSWAKTVPDNRFYLSPYISTVTSESYTMVINRLENYYKPLLAQKGYNLVVQRLWSSGTVNASAYRAGTTWYINAYGGLARWPGIITTGYAAVLCHELGHHMGGMPLYISDWAATEGQADYWAMKECMKDLGYDAYQIQAAAVNLAGVLADIMGSPTPSKYVIDQTVATKTLQGHPNAQCRLDTYLNGYLCKIRGPTTTYSSKVNSCYAYPTPTTYGKGDRPRCWFRP